MKVTVTTLSDEIFSLDVSEDLELENFKAFCEIETGVTARELMVLHEGRPLLEEKKTLKQHGIKEGDVVLLQQMHGLPNQGHPTGPSGLVPDIDFSAITIPGSGATVSSPGVSQVPRDSTSQNSPTTRQEDDPVFIRDMFLANPDQLALLKQNNPRLADALLTGDLSKFTNILKEQQKERSERERMKIRMINAGPFDVEAQRLIADEIRLRNIESNMEAAMEYNPESFGQVIMLYINCRVNGHPVKAFIDSGAQTTIMSQACADRCNIVRLVDTRWAGVAKGVGMQKIIGRVHLGQIQIEDVFLTSSFSILEDQPMDMLLGLDMLKRHQCCIDLRRNVLVIGTTETETSFLSESDLPDCARLSMNPDAMQRNAQEEDDKQLAQALQRSAEEAGGASTSRQRGNGNKLSQADKFGEEDVRKIVEMGFSRDQVIEELRKFNGDSTQAMASLFAKSLKF